MDLSIVSTLYRSAPYLREFHRRASTTAQQLGLDYEIILVNDGSPDESLELALDLRRSDPRLSVIDLSRNFGHHKAMMTGLAQARGRRVFLIDVDLEEAPELLVPFTETMGRTEADIVYGVQESRKGGLLERVTGTLFYRLFSWLSGEAIPENQLCARLMTRRFVDSLNEHRDREVFLSGLCAVTGYRQVTMLAAKRHKGVSSYTLPRRIAMTVNSIASFSSRPVEMIFYLGTIILILSLLAASILIVRRLFLGQILPGWASTMVALFLMGGLNLFCVGIVGIYLAKVFNETKDRPFTVIRRAYPAARAEGTNDRPAAA